MLTACVRWGRLVAKNNTDVVSTSSQAKRFGMVGILNTALDFFIFQALTKIFSIPLGSGYISIAKQISGTVAMINSYYFNRTFVFNGADKRNAKQQVARFFIATAIGVYIIQAGLTYLFTSAFTQPGYMVYELLRYVGLISFAPKLLTSAFIIKTVAFMIATVASLIWNFTVYKLWAFKE